MTVADWRTTGKLFDDVGPYCVVGGPQIMKM